jgi:hypothetical protein
MLLYVPALALLNSLLLRLPLYDHHQQQQQQHSSKAA